MREEMAVREATEKELRRAIRLAGEDMIFAFLGKAYGWGHTDQDFLSNLSGGVVQMDLNFLGFWF